MLRSSIDLGTNTCLLLVLKGSDVLLDLSRVVRLGEGVDKNRRFGTEPMQRALDCLKRYAQALREQGGDPTQTVCVATSQARDAANASAFFEDVARETGFHFKTLGGEDEARATFLGALIPGVPEMARERCAVIDIGGGSTEITRLEGGQVRGVSADLGSVRFSERYFMKDGRFPDAPVLDPDFWACREAIDAELEQAFAGFKSWFTESGRTWVAVAGTATTLAAWQLGLAKFDARAVDGMTLTRGDLHRLVEELKWRNRAERAGLPCMEPGRVDVILAGAMILWRAHEVLGARGCLVSTRGLRYGVLTPDRGAG